MKPATTMGAFLFALIAFGHLLRLLVGWDVIIDGKVFPMWPSGLVVLVFGLLSLMIWRESK